MNNPTKKPRIIFPISMYGLFNVITVNKEPKAPDIKPPTGPYIIAAKKIKYWNVCILKPHTVGKLIIPKKFGSIARNVNNVIDLHEFFTLK